MLEIADWVRWEYDEPLEPIMAELGSEPLFISVGGRVRATRALTSGFIRFSCLASPLGSIRQDIVTLSH